ncbi:MAG: CPBP family intramembrane metalloprotease [Eubacterium sp.]|nr:CPBP family intramembrane metalloprotease [Eubacterium sp.]
MKQFINRFKWNNIVWIIFLVIFWYILVGSVAGELILLPIFKMKDWSSSMQFIFSYYTYTIGSVVVLVLYCLVFKKNRFILRSFLPKGMGKEHAHLVVEDDYEATQNNTPKTLIFGLLLGFVTNFICIACALVHGDIKLYFDFSAAQLPVMIFGLLSVFVQSSSEELWCRGFMYERINIHYPLWVAVLANGLLFGLLHSFNDGAGVLPIAGIVVCGISYSLVKWYTGSIWIVMGMHTMWNFTQNFLFGLPNSGLVSEVSVLHLDAASGDRNLIYDYVFGVEGALPALIVDALLGVIVLILAKRSGRLGELFMSYEKAAELSSKNCEADAVADADTAAEGKQETTESVTAPVEDALPEDKDSEE